jgi:dTDP-4-dehydrorhamnose reductase
MPALDVLKACGMAETQAHYLVVGADSMVGGAVLECLRRSGLSASGTTRRKEHSATAHQHLDLAGDTSGWIPDRFADVAILCAGVTRMAECEAQPEESSRVNIDGIVRLAKALHSAGSFVIYLSTNQVFDGSIPNRAPGDQTCPTSEYGRQKARAERRLQEEGSVDAIVRFAKILGPETPLFRDWTESLRKGSSIRAFSDMTFAPIPLSCAASVLLLIAAQRLKGIFQVSGEEDLSYEQAARIGAKALGADEQLVTGAEGAATGQAFHRHTTLDTRDLQGRLGIAPPSTCWTIETAFTAPQSLGL